MTEENGKKPDLYRLANVHYPIPFETAAPLDEGLLLKGDRGDYYHLKKFEGGSRQLFNAFEAKEYLKNRGFAWTTSIIPKLSGENNLKQDTTEFYLKEWNQNENELPSRWQAQLGSELLASIHKAGEGFRPAQPDQWEWPDWIKLFEMARDTIYELHSTVIESKESKLTKYFDRTAGDAARSVEEAIVHLKRVGYYDQREEGKRKGYVSLSRIPSPSLGMKFDLVEMITPDLPACSLGTYLGQLGDWSEPKVINDVIDLITIYNQIRPLSGDEIELIKGFLRFPWHFWWVTEEYFIKAEKKKLEKVHKRYGRALKGVYKNYKIDIPAALQEL